MDWCGSLRYNGTVKFACAFICAGDWERDLAQNAMPTNDIVVITDDTVAVERDYTVRQFDCNSVAVRVHTLVAGCDADAIDLAAIMIGAHRGQVWQHERFVYEIHPVGMEANRAAGEQPTE